jgi:hypothetical protein
MSLTRGTNYTSLIENKTMDKGKKIAFKAQEICEILRTCHLSGVRQFKLDTMDVVFANPALDVPESLPVPEGLRKAMILQEQDALIKDEVALREEEISRLLIEDPVKYEELMGSGDLEEMQSRESEVADDR